MCQKRPKNREMCQKSLSYKMGIFTSNGRQFYMKETSFVYHDKRGFFLLFGQKSRKYRQIRGQIGLRSSIAAVPEPDFCISGAKRLVYFLEFFTATKNYEKGGVGWI